MELKINSCTGCPLNNAEWDSCNLSTFVEDYIYTPYKGVAEDCPLLKEPLIVSYQKQIPAL
jgi:hypothetical protein